jgi:hypothetical protein
LEADALAGLMRQERPNQSNRSWRDRGWRAQDPVGGGGCSQQITATCSPFCLSAATLRVG